MFFLVSATIRGAREFFDAPHNARSWNGMRNHQMAAVMILAEAGTGECVSGPRLVLTWRPGCENQRQSVYAVPARAHFSNFLGSFHPPIPVKCNWSVVARKMHSTSEFAKIVLSKCVCVNHLKRCKTSNLAGGWSVLQMSPSNEDSDMDWGRSIHVPAQSFSFSSMATG